MTTVPTSSSQRSGIGPALNGVGVLVVAFWLLIGPAFEQRTVAIDVVSLLALVAWAVRGFTAGRVVGDWAALVMLIAGSVMVAATNALLITPVIIAVAGVTSDLRHRLAHGVAVAATAAVIITVGSLLSGLSGSFLLGVLGGVALGFVVGISRRQNLQSMARDRELARRSVEIDAERQRSELLADRASIARDIHDVLAHSLGGLVIQLDAVEALLEKGRTDEAAARVAAARVLAAEGLGEARRAVSTLRDPGRRDDAESDALAAPDAVERLFAAHEALGGHLIVTGPPALDSLDATHRRVLAAVLRESLSNARRHASGESVTVAFSGGEPGILRVTVSNPISNPGPGAGPGLSTSGHGIAGMRERFDALGDGSTLVAGPSGGDFVVTANVVVAHGEATTAEPVGGMTSADPGGGVAS